MPKTLVFYHLISQRAINKCTALEVHSLASVLAFNVVLLTPNLIDFNKWISHQEETKWCKNINQCVNRRKKLCLAPKLVLCQCHQVEKKYSLAVSEDPAPVKKDRVV